MVSTCAQLDCMDCGTLMMSSHPATEQSTRTQKFILQWIPMMEASSWWWSLRQQPQGHKIIRDLLHQMLSALAVLQGANITHRYLCLHHLQAHHDTCKGLSTHTILDSVSGHVLHPPGFFCEQVEVTQMSRARLFTFAHDKC